MAVEQTTKVKTGKVRFSYANVFIPTAMDEEAEKKYNISLLIPKTDKIQVERIKAAITIAEEEAKVKFKGKLPKQFQYPLHDGDVDKPEDEAYAGMYYLSAKSKTKPGIVDKDLQPITEQDEFYSGCWGRATINFYVYEKGKGGIACGLNNLQKLEDGEPLSGRASAEDDFKDDDYTAGTGAGTNAADDDDDSFLN